MTGPFHTATGVDALVSGKRRVPRTEVRLPARVKGVHGEFHATVCDISMDGALVCLPVSELDGAPKGRLGPAEQFALLERHFRDSFDLRFLHCDVVVETQVVRLLVDAEEQPLHEPELALGCRFVSPLTSNQEIELGLVGDGPDFESWGEATARHALRWGCKPTQPVTAFLHDGRDGVAGPPFAGPVHAIGRAALTVRLVGLSRVAARTQLGAAPIATRILRGASEVVALETEFVTVRYCDRPSPGIEVLLSTATALPRAVRKHFRKV